VTNGKLNLFSKNHNTALYLLTIHLLFPIFECMNIRAIAKQIGMDYDNVLEDFCGDVSAIKAKLENYIEDASFSGLTSIIDKGDTAEVKKAAHKVRKASEKLGLTVMAKYAAVLENSKEDKMQSAYETLEKEYRKVEEILTKKDDEEVIA